MIYEMPVYCGKLKEWRILNLLTGTVYSSDFPSEDAAFNAIEDGQVRAEYTVKAIRLRQARQALLDAE